MSATWADPTATWATPTTSWTGATITKSATGVYTKNITASTAGLWSYTWTGTGTAADVESGVFDVVALDPSESSPFATEADAFSTLVIYRGDGSIVDNNTLSSTNALVFIDIVGSVVNDLTVGSYPSTHAALNLGFGMALNLTTALALGFDPTGLGIVTASNVQESIEELDAAVGAVPTLASGTYTPTLTNVANVSSSTAALARYTRIGDNVTVYGRASIDPTSTAVSTKIRISIPVASDLGNDSDLAGVAVGDLSDESAGHIVADYTNNEAVLEAFPVSTSQHTYAYTFSYTVI